MVRNYLTILLFLICNILSAQKSVHIDGRLQPILNEFIVECDKYKIDYHEKFFQLKNIDIATLEIKEHNTVLGMVTRDENGDIENILINWVAMLDPEILRIVTFHELSHHFLDYKHTCENCDDIMAKTNTRYFDIARDWDNKVEHLFLNSPVYLNKQ